jgi:hypothetical protein
VELDFDRFNLCSNRGYFFYPFPDKISVRWFDKILGKFALKFY